VATKKIKSIKGRTMRLTRLDECGNVSTDPCAVIVTDGFISVTIANEVESGEEYTLKNAWGDFCVAEKDGDRVKWANVTIAMCEVDPEILDMIGGANPVTAAGNTIGATFGTEPNPNSFAIEVWTKKAGGDACAGGTGLVEWGYFVVPFVKNGIIDGDITIENGPLTLTMKGEGQEAPSTWGLGPHGDSPMKSAFPAGDLYGIVVTDVQPPNTTDGCEPIGGVRSKANPGDTFAPDPEITASDATNAALLTGEGFIAVPTTAWAGTEHITIGGYSFFWNGTAWKPGDASRLNANPGRTYPADVQITASDVTNAGKLTGEGFVAVPQTAWTTGQKITVGTFDFNWTSSAWAAGAHA